MKSLTKVQIEAIVDEIQDRLNSFGSNGSSTILSKRAEGEWVKLQEKINKMTEMELIENKLEDALSEYQDEVRDFRSELKTRVREFEGKHGVKVYWEYLDKEEGEKPEVRVPVEDYREKITRQITIIGIDNPEIKTAEEMIQMIVKSFSKVE